MFSFSPSYLIQLRACLPEGPGLSRKWAVNPSSPRWVTRPGLFPLGWKPLCGGTWVGTECRGRDWGAENRSVWLWGAESCSSCDEERKSCRRWNDAVRSHNRSQPVHWFLSADMLFDCVLSMTSSFSVSGCVIPDIKFACVWLAMEGLMMQQKDVWLVVRGLFWVSITLIRCRLSSSSYFPTMHCTKEIGEQNELQMVV